jgi:chemotaxis protein MotA
LEGGAEMLVIIGLILVLVAVLGSYVMMGGKLGVLWQPFEFVIIFGAGAGGMVIGNPIGVLKGVPKALIAGLKGPTFKKDHYIELLAMLFELFKLAKQKGPVALEPHVENPDSSDIFSKYPKISHDHHVMDFIRDYLRMITLGTDKAHEMETIMDVEIEAHHKNEHALVSALSAMADSFPAVGIVAAVLGVIKTMGAMDQPPEVLGKLIGAALVGTFAGIFMCYGFFGPLATTAGKALEADARIYDIIKTAILAYLQGYAPAIAVEMARKAVDHDMRPSFYDLEALLAK